DERQADRSFFLSDITDDNLTENFQTVLLMTYSDSFKEFQPGSPFFLNDINNDNLTENFQNVLPIIECSNNFKERQADLPFFLSNDNNNNLMERFKTALTLFPNETDMVERNDNFKESTCSQNYYMEPSQEGIDIEPQNYMDIEVQKSINKELSQEKSIHDQEIQPNLYKTVEIVTHLKQVDNNSMIVPDLHIFNQLRIPYAYTTETGQHIQKKIKYAYGFGKMKAALNLALYMGCKENGSQHISTRNSAINLIDSNLYSRKEKSNHDRNTAVKTPLNALNSNSNEIDGSISAETSQGIKENTTKQ
ncbi:18126_t:CDS:2, partial [Gigaspora margarita]